MTVDPHDYVGTLVTDRVIASVSEGHCPLCSGRLVVPPGRYARIRHRAHGYCEPCDVYSRTVINVRGKLRYLLTFGVLAQERGSRAGLMGESDR